jgi:hypothetical protein
MLPRSPTHSPIEIFQYLNDENVMRDLISSYFQFWHREKSVVVQYGDENQMKMSTDGTEVC